MKKNEDAVKAGLQIKSCFAVLMTPEMISHHTLANDRSVYPLPSDTVHFTVYTLRDILFAASTIGHLLCCQLHCGSN